MYLSMGALLVSGAWLLQGRRAQKRRRDSTATFEHPLGATTSAAGRNRAAICPPSKRRQPLAARNPADRRWVLFSKAVTFPWTPYFHDAYAPRMASAATAAGPSRLYQTSLAACHHGRSHPEDLSYNPVSDG